MFNHTKGIFVRQNKPCDMWHVSRLILSQVSYLISPWDTTSVRQASNISALDYHMQFYQGNIYRVLIESQCTTAQITSIWNIEALFKKLVQIYFKFKIATDNLKVIFKFQIFIKSNCIKTQVKKTVYKRWKICTSGFVDLVSLTSFGCRCLRRWGGKFW